MHLSASCTLPSDIDNWRGPFHARRRWTALHPRKAVDAVVVRQLLVAVHGHALTVPAKLAVGRWRNGARGVTAHSRALLEGQQLLSTEGLVVNLGGGLDEVLKVGACEEVAEVDELAVVLVLDCDGSAKLFWLHPAYIPLMTPHLVWRPRTFCPLTTTVLSEPMTAKGMRSCNMSATISNAFVQYWRTLMWFLWATSSASSSSFS